MPEAVRTVPNRGNFTVSQLMSLDACTRCGECQKWCDTYTGEDLTAPQLKLRAFKSLLIGERLPGLLARLLGGRKLGDDEMEHLSAGVYGCTLCARCKMACPAEIDLPGLWLSMRQELVDRGVFPDGLNTAGGAITEERNVFSYPGDERATWADFMDEAPDDRYQRDHAEVVYFVGCLTSFSPAVQGIAESVVKLLTIAGLDFTIMGSEEWCCGFPLIVAGMKERTDELIAHNVEKIREIGARTMVFTCPSCFHTWRHHYAPHLPGVEFLHLTQLLQRLLGEGRIKFDDVPVTATYHDPCDLGRNSGVYEAPREVIAAFPALSFVEVDQNREQGRCCGGGGDLEICNATLASSVATRTLSAIRNTGAEMAITACPQCKRMLLSALGNSGNGFQILDIAELAMRAAKT